jgi:hypothetical protein
MIFAAEPTVGLILLLLLTLMVAVVYGVGSSIKKKHPIAAISWLMVPVGLLLSGAILFPYFAYAKSAMQAENGTPWSVAPAIASVPPVPPIPAMPPIHFNGVISVSWIKLAIVLLIVVGIAKLIGRRANDEGRRRCGWGKTAGIGFLLVLAAVLLMRLSPSNHATQNLAVADRELADWRRGDAEIGQQDKADAQRHAGEAQERANELLKSQSMQELWEKLNKPRIKLDNDEHGASMTVGVGAQQVAFTASDQDGAKVTVPVPAATPESLALSLARLERMVEQASAVADQVSEAGTLVGKAMIALSDSIDSRSRGAAVNAAVDSERIDAVPAGVVAAPEVQALVTGATDLMQKTVEISFDQGKLNQYGLSFDKVRGILGRDGYWRGATVRFVVDEGRIVVSGKLPADYQSGLGGTLIGAAGTTARPVHLTDVAAITASPEFVIADAKLDVAPSEGAPAWIRQTQKKVGNTQRVVLVAGEFATVEECYEQADELLKLATIEHINQFAGIDWEADKPMYGPGDRVKVRQASMLDRMGIGVDFLRREIARDEYLETVERSFGPMKKLYTLVEFTPSVDAELLRRWDELRRQERFAVVGAGAGSVLGLIGLAFGLLKVDTWTKGYYTKRLFLGVPAAIIGVLALLGFAAG